jgi:hypothetical protein
MSLATAFAMRRETLYIISIRHWAISAFFHWYCHDTSAFISLADSFRHYAFIFAEMFISHWYAISFRHFAISADDTTLRWLAES